MCSSKKILLLGIMTGFLGHNANAQGDWETYMAEVNHHPASVLVDMSYSELAPKADLSYLVVTGPVCKRSTAEKLPVRNEIPVLDAILDKLDSNLNIEKALVGTL